MGAAIGINANTRLFHGLLAQTPIRPFWHSYWHKCQYAVPAIAFIINQIAGYIKTRIHTHNK